MKIAEFSIRNPLVVGGLAVALCLFGLLAYTRLGVATTPDLEIPTVQVVTIYPGADPETVETTVTKPIEDALAALPNIARNGLVSTSSAGVSMVDLTFTEAANPDMISSDVQRIVNGARGQLPSDAETPSVTKFDLGFIGVATLVFSGDQPPVRMQEVAEKLIQRQLNAVPGVASVSIRSGIARELHVLVDEDKLRSRGLSINQVVGALQSQQIEVPAGTITRGDRDLSVYFDGLASAIPRLGDAVVAQTTGGPIYLRDVARVEDTLRRRDSSVRVDGREGVGLVIAKQPGANTIAVVDGVRATMAQLEPQLPPGTRLDIVVDQSTYTARSFHTVQSALLQAVLITGLILLLFLHTWRSTLIVLVSIPISLLSTILVMSLLGYNLNLMTMIALTVSVGILVDDSIVVLENIYRHLDMGKSPFAAAVDGRTEIGVALAATDRVASRLETELRALPEVRGVYSTVDAGRAQIAALMVPPRERGRSAAQFGEDLRRGWEGRFPGAKIRIAMPNAFGFSGFGGAPIQVQVLGDDPATLDDLSTRIEAAVRAAPGAADVQNGNDDRQSQLRATVDWTRAADLGVTPRDAGVALRTALDGFTANGLQFRQAGRTAVPIRVLRDGAERMAPEDVSRLPVGGARGNVDLGQFTTLREVRILTGIRHVNRLRSITIGAGAGDGRLVGDVQTSVEAAVATVPLPAGYRVTYAGQGEGGGEAFAEIGRAIGVALLLMYMLLMMLFGSVTRPLAVLMSLPLAVVGALGGLALTHNPFTIFSMIGIVVLTGLVGKNAILLVDYTHRLRTEGLDRTAALLKAGPTRLRPIVMTTVSVMAALLPIASGLEEGSELLVSVAVVLIGGLLTSTLLTLVFVPAMYTIFDDLETGVARLGRRLLGAVSPITPVGRMPPLDLTALAPAAVVAVDGEGGE